MLNPDERTAVEFRMVINDKTVEFWWSDGENEPVLVAVKPSDGDEALLQPQFVGPGGGDCGLALDRAYAAVSDALVHLRF